MRERGWGSRCVIACVCVCLCLASWFSRSAVSLWAGRSTPAPALKVEGRTAWHPLSFFLFRAARFRSCPLTSHIPPHAGQPDTFLSAHPQRRAASAPFWRSGGSPKEADGTCPRRRASTRRPALASRPGPPRHATHPCYPQRYVCTLAYPRCVHVESPEPLLRPTLCPGREPTTKKNLGALLNPLLSLLPLSLSADVPPGAVIVVGAGIAGLATALALHRVREMRRREKHAPISVTTCSFPFSLSILFRSASPSSSWKPAPPHAEKAPQSPCGRMVLKPWTPWAWARRCGKGRL